MKLIKFLLIVLLPVFGYSQIQGDGEVYLTGELIDAQFNGGGIDKFSKYLNEQFDYSKVTKPGKLEAAFTIDETGSVTKIRIIQVLDMESATEFIRVLKLCPKWKPAMRNGKPISIEIKYPMVFKEKQKNDSLIVSPAENKVGGELLFNTASVEKKPDFSGGLKAFYNYIGQNFKIPDVKGLSGKVVVSFVIEKDGSVTDIKVVRDIGYGTKEEAIRVLKNSPNWIPGEQDGKKVRVLYTLPITIQPSK